MHNLTVDSTRENGRTIGEKMVALGNDVSLQVAEIGQGEPVVLICGTGQHHWMWAPLLPALCPRFKVISYNHRGIGESGRGSGPIGVRSLADDLAELLDALSVDRAHLIGWSLGSAVAQEFALSHPARVASLVLACTWGRTDQFQHAVFTGLSHPWRTGDRAAGLVALRIVFSPELLVSGRFVPVTAQLDTMFPSTGSQMSAMVEQWDADGAHDALDRLGAIGVPTLVISGKQDLLTPARSGRAVSDRIPGARFELLTGPGSSHGLVWERTEEFTSLVSGFLAGHPL
ncbi:3-oxoadipate enol-lactonase [Pseudonocardia xinjiangensis]